MLLLKLCGCAARAKHAEFRVYRFVARVWVTKKLKNERWGILTKSMRTEDMNYFYAFALSSYAFDNYYANYKENYKF